MLGRLEKNLIKLMAAVTVAAKQRSGDGSADLFATLGLLPTAPAQQQIS